MIEDDFIEAIQRNISEDEIEKAKEHWDTVTINDLIDQAFGE